MLKMVLCLLVIVAGPISVSGQAQPQISLPSLDEIVARYEKAVGGKAAFEKLTSRVSKGSFVLGGMGNPGTTEIYQKAPNKMVTVTDIPDFGVVRSGVNGTVAWLDTPQSGTQELTGDAAAASRRGADFYEQIRLKETYPQIVVKGKASFEGHDVYVVQATPAEGAPELLSFDANSGLLVRSQTQVNGPMGAVDIDTKLSDYRQVDGVNLPFKIDQERSDFSFTIQLTEVKHNVPIDDAKFEKPKSQ
jgi:outer membrane lipoprotein-sorting protein